MTVHLPSGFVTFLFTDIEGSTRLFRRLGDTYLPLLERHHELLREVWAVHNGSEVKTEGDAFFVAFARPEDAVDAAIEAQQAIASEQWPDGVALRVRMGIHSGLASPRHDDYIAYAVHQAARVVGAAHGGQVLVSEETQRAVGKTKATLRSLGRFRIRDFDEPIELFQALVPGLPEIQQQPRATPAMGHNLAEPTTSFLGREKDLETLAEIIEPGRLLSIVGPGGSGKTRLATQLGLRVADQWPGGVWLVELAPTKGETPLAGLAAEALGISVAGRDPLDAIGTDLSDAFTLMILDNCEHVVAAAADLTKELLRRSPSLGVLATTREPLGISEEYPWRIRPLDTAGDAVDLFISRATSAGSNLPDSAVGRELIARICARLDGNPLAIELAAARVGAVGLASMESALDDRFRLLSSRRRDLEPRQQSMEALLDWSHDLLDPQEQTVFRRLATFQDRFTLDGAEKAVSDPQLSHGAAVDSVWALVDKSLLTVDGTSNETRYSMSETVREYALNHLDSAEKVAVQRRLGDWYMERFGPWTVFSASQVSDLRLELDNIRAMIDGLAGDECEIAQTLAVSVSYLREITGEVVEGTAEVDRYLNRLMEPSVMRSLLLVVACRLRHRRGIVDYGSLLDEAEALLQTGGPEPEWAAGSVATMRALWLEDNGHHEEALAAAARVGAGEAPLVARARSLSAIGLLKGGANDDEGALAAHRLGLEAEEALGGPIEIALAHNNIAEYATRLGLTAEAARHQLHALELAAQIGMTVLVAFSLVIAARTAAGFEKWPDAVSLHGAAERWLEESGYTLQGPDAEISEELLAEGRRQLGESYAQQWNSGHALPLGAAIEAARTALTSAATTD